MILRRDQLKKTLRIINEQFLLCKNNQRNNL